MNIKSALSVVALLSGVAFAGSAYAQTMVGNNDVSDADLPYVQAQCDALLLNEQNEFAAEMTTGDEAKAADSEPTGLEADTAARNSSTKVDLDTITLEDCRTAGLVD
ncbi:hypothetical protein [Devosia faecipullorum]|uniref:hypothetical protein n=1 Tax=Devosia faecipullorum TaxID=2755039 RepID=UPI00187B4D71|nr:hypothetical protein [Devosia faecipullorum]MBE7732293.1 hypothetical protein [Devosia faecipullorum]